MPVIIDQETIAIRVAWLSVEYKKLLEEQANCTDKDRASQIAIGIHENECRAKECHDWLKILDQDPGWGQLLNVDGKLVPKMPKFRDPEEKRIRLETWGTAKGLNEHDLKAIREYRVRDNAQEDVHFMDGLGPIANEASDEEKA